MMEEKNILSAKEALELTKTAAKEDLQKIIEKIEEAAKHSKREVKIKEPSQGLEFSLTSLGYTIISRGKGFHRSYYVKW